MVTSLKKWVMGFCLFTLVGHTAVTAQDKDIVDTAVGAGSFKTLAAALGAADLVDALKGDGPFTVFAPTDEAFAKLPAGTVENLLKPENKGQLTAILTYHVVSGKVPAAKVVDLTGATTLNGQRVDIDTSDGVKVDGATVVKPDIMCSNGVIHVIDSVILPSSDNLVAVADKAGSFTTLIAAAKAAGLVDALTGEESLTVFAPTDEAFGKLPAGTIDSLLKPENKAQLVSILKYHVVPGRVYSDAVVGAKMVKTLQGSSAPVAIVDGAAKIGEATIVKTDIDASNGVIHVIDTVIMPPPAGAFNARQTIESAIASGAATFNSGNHAACAQLYMSTMQQLVASPMVPQPVVSHLKQTMAQASTCSCPTTRSWTLRHALDSAYAQIPAGH